MTARKDHTTMHYAHATPYAGKGQVLASDRGLRYLLRTVRDIRPANAYGMLRGRVQIDGTWREVVWGPVDQLWVEMLPAELAAMDS
jgi:hypothetical protein